MAGKLERTDTPGVFRRHRKGCTGAGRCSCAYVIEWRAHGRKHTETHRTLAEAREAKRGHEADVARGEFAAAARETLHDYARSWVERYQGNGRRGFREETRHEYRGLLERYALTYFPPRLTLSEITPRHVAEFIGWLVKRSNGRGGTLTDKSVRNALGPLAACLASAKREGLIRHNPVDGSALPHRPTIEEDEELPRPFPGETMELVVSLVHPGHRLMFELLAATGVRRSELLAFEGRHLVLAGERPLVRIRQRARVQKGRGMVVGPLKSRHARRDLPIPLALADRLAARRTSDDALVFASPLTGRPYDPRHLELRVLSPACSEAGVEWAGFHTFRHTVASRLFADDRNAVEVQKWLGHHSPSFTLDTYVHLLDGDLGPPLEPLRVGAGSADCPETSGNEAAPVRGRSCPLAGKTPTSRKRPEGEVRVRIPVAVPH
jgi:integrase